MKTEDPMALYVVNANPRGRVSRDEKEDGKKVDG